MIIEGEWRETSLAFIDFIKINYNEDPYDYMKCIYDEERGINVLFLTNGENRIELIEKCTEESDVDFIAKGKRSMPYHICYEVNNMEESVDFLKQNRFIVIKKPSNAIAIQNRRVAFLYCKECGLIELIVADTPGHEEYTRNMAVGASFAELAIILVDASQGILIQTKRHARICSLMGIRHFVFAVNKMDLVYYSQKEFEKIEKEINEFARKLDLRDITVIPVSATNGDNVTNRLNNMNWYKGKTLIEYLETVDVDDALMEEGLVLPVQRVCRPDYSFRGFQGQVESGCLCIGDEIEVLPSKQKAKVESLFNTDRNVNKIHEGQAVTIKVDREIDISRGCVIVKDTSLKVSDTFKSTVLWMDDTELMEGKSFLLKLGTKLVPATVLSVDYRIDVNTGEQIVSDKLNKNEIAVCKIGVTEKIVLDEFEKHRSLGHFILIDRITNMTAACGVVNHVMRRTDDLFWQEMDVTRNVRANMKNQTPLTLWFTGLSGAGKSTIANEIEKRLVIAGKHTMCLDGDNVRLGLNKDLGFVEKDRGESIRRIAEVAKLFNDAGLIVITSCISPYELDRDTARKIIGNSNFVEVYVSTPLSQCEKRDVKGLYKKARKGQILNFTGVNSIYEMPSNAEIVVDTTYMGVEETADYVMSKLDE